MTKDDLAYVDITREAEKPKTVVCVTDQFNCDRIIKSARVVCDITASDLSVINVSSPSRYQDPTSIEYLFKVSAHYGGTMTVIYNDNPAKAVIQYIKKNKVANVITGMPEGQNSVLHKIWSKFTHINFFTVDSSGELCEVANPAVAARALAQTQNTKLATTF